MKKLKKIDEIENALNSNSAMLLYVSAPNCNVCDALKPKIEELFIENFPKISLFETNIADVPEVGGRFNIFSAPSILIFFDGKEFARVGRNISLSAFKSKIEKIYNLYFE